MYEHEGDLFALPEPDTFEKLAVVLWIYKTYAWQVSLAVYWLEFVMCIFYVVAYTIDQLRFQFNPGTARHRALLGAGPCRRVLLRQAMLTRHWQPAGHVFALAPLTDIFTIVPLLLQRGLGWVAATRAGAAAAACGRSSLFVAISPCITLPRLALHLHSFCIRLASLLERKRAGRQ